MIVILIESLNIINGSRLPTVLLFHWSTLRFVSESERTGIMIGHLFSEQRSEFLTVEVNSPDLILIDPICIWKFNFEAPIVCHRLDHYYKILSC